MTAPHLQPDMQQPVPRLLFVLRDIAGEAAHVDLRASADDAAAVRAMSQQLAAMVDRTTACFAALQTTSSDDPADTLVLDLGAEDELALPDPDPADLRVADMCFAGTLELRRVQRELAAATAPNEVLVAAETARRKLRRAIRAVLEAARESGVYDVLGGEHQGHHHVADVASGLAVRRLYAQFRRALREPEAATPDAVLVALRYAVGAMANLVASPDYPDVRASDRAVLRDLRERALRWARGERSLVAGLNLLADVRTCGDLLRGINRRQELRAHDAVVVAAALSAKASSGKAGPRDAWRARLEPLFGLDDALDELLERSRITCDDVLAAALEARLGQLR